MKLTTRILTAFLAMLAIAGTCQAQQMLRRPVMRPAMSQVRPVTNITALTAQAQARARFFAMNHLDRHLLMQRYPFGQPYGMAYGYGMPYMSGYMGANSGYMSSGGGYMSSGGGYMSSSGGYMSSSPSSMSSYPSSGNSGAMAYGGYDYGSLFGGDYGLLPDGGYGGAYNMPEAAAKPKHNAGVIAIKVPLALADVTFEGQKTKETGVTRQILTPALVPNQLYTFTVQANWTEGGVAQNQTRHVQVAAGQTVVVDFRKGP